MCDSHKCTKNLFAYGSKKPIDAAGSFTAEISVGKTSIMAEFIVLAGHGQNLLGKETALCLNVLRLGPEHMNSVRKMTYWISLVMYSVDSENSRTLSERLPMTKHWNLLECSSENQQYVEMLAYK